ESERRAGYYLVDPCWPWLAELRHMPPLLARAELADGAPRWITATMLQLLAEAAPPGQLIPVMASITTGTSTRALDGVAGPTRARVAAWDRARTVAAKGPRGENERCHPGAGPRQFTRPSPTHRGTRSMTTQTPRAIDLTRVQLIRGHGIEPGPRDNVPAGCVM